MKVLTRLIDDSMRKHGCVLEFETHVDYHTS